MMQYAAILEWKERTSRWVAVLQNAADNGGQNASLSIGSLAGTVEVVLEKEDGMLPKALYAMSAVCVVADFDKHRGFIPQLHPIW